MNLFWLTLVVLAVAALLRSEAFFYLAYVVVGLQLVAYVWVRRSSRRLTCTRELPAAAFQGEAIPATITVQNKSLLPLPWLALNESLPPSLRTPPAFRHVLSLGAGETRRLHYTLVGQKRGLYRVGPLSLRVGDVFGLGEQVVESTSDNGLTIYPRVLPLAELGLPATLPFGVLPARSSLFTDPARPMGTRDYQPGDSMRRVDWKNSARVGQLQVRRYQPAIAMETLIALSFGLDEYPTRFSYDALERAAIAAASIAAHVVGQRQPLGFCTTGLDPLTNAVATPLPVAHGRAHFLALLQTLGQLEPASRGDLPTAITQASGHLGWGGTVVVITGTCTPTLIERLLPLRRRGMNLALVLLEANEFALALAQRHNIAAYNVNREGRPGAGW